MNRLARVAAAVAALVVLVGVVVWFVGRSDDTPAMGVACEPRTPEDLAVEVVGELPHDPEAFTQGLEVVDGELWEGTGRRGESTLRRVDIRSGEVLASADLDPELFGEGLAEGADGELLQLTWTEGRALRWDPGASRGAGPALVGEFAYDGEGWGLSGIGTGELAMSDGSDTLQIRSSEDFSVSSVLTVQRLEGPADGLNELEWDGERLWANRWQSAEILRIDLDCGSVDGVVDAEPLVARAAELISEAGLERDLDRVDVLNGIAALGPEVGAGDEFLVTGKRWPVAFQVRFVGTT